jgi:hypothetical protein
VVGDHLHQPAGEKQLSHGIALIVVVLQQQPAAWGKGRPGSINQGSDRFESIRSSVESQARFMLAHH